MIEEARSRTDEVKSEAVAHADEAEERERGDSTRRRGGRARIRRRHKRWRSEGARRRADGEANERE